MFQRGFKIEDIGKLSGGEVEEAFRQQLTKVVEDCEDRPGEKKARQIVITLSLKPVSRQDGALCDVDLSAKLSTKMPPMEGFPMTARVLHGGQLAFNEYSPDNPDQKTLDEQV